MHMINVFAAADMFPAGTEHELATRLSRAVARASIDKTRPADPERCGTYIHRMVDTHVQTAANDRARTVRVQILTPPDTIDPSATDRLFREAVEVVVDISGDPAQGVRTWVIHSDAAWYDWQGPDGAPLGPRSRESE